MRRNQFGGTIGGPIRKDKLFLFSGFQATRTRTAPPQSIGFVPTQQVLDGDFSTIESAACQSNKKAVSLKDPSTGQPFANNQIPTSLFSRPSLGLLKYIPVSSDPCGRLIYAAPSPSNENQYIGRADWLQSTKNTISGRYYIADYANPGVFTDNILTTTRSGLNERTQAVGVAAQTSVSPTLVNSVHATYSRLITNRTPPAGMPSPVDLGVNMFNSTPHYIDLSVTNSFAMGGGSNAPSYFARDQFQLADDIDMAKLLYATNLFHGSLGGRIIRNRTFFFGFRQTCVKSTDSSFLLTTTAFVCSSGRWFGTFSCKTVPSGLPSSTTRLRKEAATDDSFAHGTLRIETLIRIESGASVPPGC